MDAHLDLHLGQIGHQQQDLVVTNVDSLGDFRLILPGGRQRIDDQAAAAGPDDTIGQLFLGTCPPGQVHRQFCFVTLDVRLACYQFTPSGLQFHGPREPFQDIQPGPADHQLQLRLFDGERLALDFELGDESLLEEAFGAEEHLPGGLEIRVRDRDRLLTFLQLGEVVSLFVGPDGDLGRGQAGRGLGEAGS